MSSERIANATPGAPTAPSFLSNAIQSNGMVYCSGQLGQTPDGKMVEGSIGKRVVSASASASTGAVVPLPRVRRVPWIGQSFLRGWR